MRKRLLTIIATAVMVVTMIPAMAFADSTSTTPGLEGLYLRYVEKNDEGGIYFNVTNLTPGETAKIKVELYSGDTLLQTKGIERAASKNGTLGGTFYTVGVSSSWSYTEWTPYDHIVPTEVKLYVNDEYCVTEKVAFTAEEWANWYETKEPAGLEGLYLRYVEKNNEGGIYFNVTNLTPGETEKIKVELYSGDALLQTKGIERAASKNGTLGGTFYTVGVSSSWSYTEWTPYDDVVPTHVKVYVNGLYMSTAEVDLTAEEWAEFYGTEEPASEPAPVKKPENSPNTGDNSVLPLAIAGIALAAIASVVATRRREN